MTLRVWPWRRTVQVAVLALLFALPLVSRYSHILTARQLDRQIERLDGTLPGVLLESTDRVARIGIPDGEGGVPTRRPRKAILERTRGFLGSVWSARVFGFSFTDLLAGAESIVTARDAALALLIGIAIPLLATLLLGRVFCSWICPWGLISELVDKLRPVVRFLEIQPGRLKFSHANKYLLLAIGLLFGLLGGLPLLHYVYPPAILSRETHTFVMTMFDRAEEGRFGFALAGLTGASLFLVGLLALELFVAPRFWCATLCPGGALYALLGRFRPVRLRRNIDTCTRCGDCDAVCPMALHPMTDRTGMECDNCGICVDACPPRSLVLRLSLSSDGFRPKAPAAPPPPSSPGVPAGGRTRVLTGLLLGFVLALGAAVADAHHILGIPHYAYDQSYPQRPVLKLRERVGEWEFQLTGYPGVPVPGERTQIHVFIRHAAAGEAKFDRVVHLEVFQVPAVGTRRSVHGPEAATVDRGIFKFFPTYPEEGNYELVLSYPDVDGFSTLRYPMVVGEPGSPWMTLAGYGAGLGLFLVVVRAIRIKRARVHGGGRPC